MPLPLRQLLQEEHRALVAAPTRQLQMRRRRSPHSSIERTCPAVTQHATGSLHACTQIMRVTAALGQVGQRC